MKKLLPPLVTLPFFFFFVSPAFASILPATWVSDNQAGSDYSVTVDLGTSSFDCNSYVNAAIFTWPDVSPYYVQNSSGNAYCSHTGSEYTFLFPSFNLSSDLPASEYQYSFDNGSDQWVLNHTPATDDIKIEASPSTGSKTVNTPFNVAVKVNADGEEFNAARATISVSSNMEVTGIHSPSSNACNLQYTTTPTTSNPSFAGAIFGSSSNNCTVYTMTLKPISTGTGTITFTNGSIKAYLDNSEILTGVENASFTLENGATPTPTPLLEFQISNPLETYKTSFNLTGTKLSTITNIFVNGSDENSTYPDSTTWQVPVTLTLGNNNFTIYGKDDSDNQTATQTVTVDRHTLGDINGDGNVDLIDASLFAVDWDKTEDLTYVLSDMNDDGQVNLTDLSILAKLQ